VDPEKDTKQHPDQLGGGKKAHNEMMIL